MAKSAISEQNPHIGTGIVSGYPYPLSHPESRSDPIGRSESSSGCETQNWDYLPDFFFLNQTATCGYGPHLITESKYYIQIKRTTTGVVSIKIYTHITESHLLIQNCTFTFTIQSTEPTCSEPLQVCWPSCMRMFANVFFCTYTD